MKRRRRRGRRGLEGRDNRKSATAGAKDGQFSAGFVTRESLHKGHWPHPTSFSSSSNTSSFSSSSAAARSPSATGTRVPRLRDVRLSICTKLWKGTGGAEAKIAAFPGERVTSPRMHVVPRRIPTSRKYLEDRKVSERPDRIHVGSTVSRFYHWPIEISRSTPVFHASASYFQWLIQQTLF